MRSKVIFVALMILLQMKTNAGTITFNDGGSHEFNSYTTDTLVVEDSSGGNPTTLNLVSGTYVDNHYVYAYDFSELNVVAGYAYATLSMDSSTVNITGGEVMYPHSHNSSTTTVSGGECYSIIAHDLSTLNVSDGSVNYLAAQDSSMVDIVGGDVFGLYARNSSTVSIRSGNITYWLKAYDSSIVDIYGYNLSAYDTGGRWGDGFVTGNWDDGTPFTIDLVNDTSITYSHINLVPEPTSTTLVLLGLGVVTLRRKHRLFLSA